MKRLLFGLDYDDTFTADPDLWRQFITSAELRGHRVVCVTARRMVPDFSREPMLPPHVPIVCAGPDFKRHAAARAGYPVDIWIDDMPGMIEPARVLQWN